MQKWKKKRMKKLKLKYSNLLTDVRQARKWYNQQQAGLGPTIGRYERDEMKPSIDAAEKMADILGYLYTRW